MESRRHQQRSRSARGPRPPPLPPQNQPHPPRHQPPRNQRQNPSRSPGAAASIAQFHMEDDAISTLMDIDDSPLGAAGFLDEEDGEGEMFVAPHRAGRGAGEVRGPLPFTGFFNSFDGADFDDADLA